MTTPLFLPPESRKQLRELLFWIDRAMMETAEGRRGITKNHPLLFALIYFPHHLSSPETGGRTSLSKLHIDMAYEARNWRYEQGPGAYRVAWVAPRDSGKTTWNFLILPVWAMAHEWRMFPAFFSDAGEQALKHFATLRRELETNRLLRNDFPELCTPGKVDLAAARNTANEYYSSGGHAITAHGIDASSLGLKIGSMRPDLLILDDVEPTGMKYSASAKEKRLYTIIDAVFAMNLNACVVMVGTVTRFGSIMHEVVQSAANNNSGIREPWIAEENIDCRYYPAIVTNPKTGAQESLWAQRWTYDYLDEQRHTRSFNLNYMNMPLSAENGYWNKNHFNYDYSGDIVEEILSIDPAVKSGAKNDATGISVVGFPKSKDHAQVRWAMGVRLSPDGLRRLIDDILRKNPMISTILIESNQGGDFVVQTLSDKIPARIRVVSIHEHEAKAERIYQLFDWYERGWVSHLPGLHALEEQELAYPDVTHDDIVDSVAKGVKFYLAQRPIPRGGAE